MTPVRSTARLALSACLLAMTPFSIAQESPPHVPPTAPEPQGQGQPDQPTKPAPIPGPVPTKPSAPGKPAAGQPTTATPPATPPEAPGEVPEGRRLFLAAQDVIKKAQAITYRAKSYATGPMLSTYISRSQADVRMLRTPGGWQVRCTGSGTSMSLKEEAEFDMAWLGVHNEWVDHTAKKVFEKSVHDTKGPAVQLAPSSKVEEFLEANPFSAEIASPDYVIEPQREQAGVKCDSILAVNGRVKVRWLLGVEDHLPRWKERIIENSAAAGSMITEISNITTDANNPPRMTAEMLRVTVPEGYAQDRAPMPAPPAAPVTKSPAAPTTNPTQVAPPKTVGPPAPPVPTPEPRAEKAPDFDLKDGKGNPVSLASLKGSVVVLEFAGTWCLPLREAHPEFEALTKDYSHLPVKTYMLDVREKSSANAIDDLSKAGYTFGLLLDADPVAKLYNIQKYPSYAVIDKDGNLTRTEAGYTKIETMNSVRDAVNAATHESGPPKPEAKLEAKAGAGPAAPLAAAAPPKK